MFSYINDELPAIVNAHFHTDPERKSITGFSMGGMGALLSYLKCSGKYRSVSAFAPISNPSEGAWGKNAFEKFFGSIEGGKDFDPTLVVATYQGPKTPILIEVGSDDKFLKEGQLRVEDFVAAAHKAGIKVDYRFREGYNHSFFYVASFFAEHFEFHSRYLKA
jgi:S-formylglutathione hydrolase